MSDLIKRLREADTYNKKYYAVDPLHQEAADRIDELVKERDDYAHKLMASGNTYTEMHLEIERLSDKLAKAVEALQVLSCKCTSNCDWDRGDICPSWTARTVLAELEGK